MRVAIYARVSADDKGQDPENQLRELQDWVINSGHIILVGSTSITIAVGKVPRSGNNLPRISLDRNPWCNGRTIVPASLLVRAEGQPTLL